MVLDPKESPEEIKRREVVLDPKESPEEIKSGEAELGSESWTVLCFSCFSTAAIDIVLVTLLRTAVETAIAEYTSCFAMARSPLP